MLNIPQNAALILIDVQKGFDHPSHWGQRNNPTAESVIAEILSVWRETGRHVVHVRHDSVEEDSPLRPGQTGNDFKDGLGPIAGEHVEAKIVNSAFIGTGLEDFLRSRGVNTLVLAGISTDHCVSTTTRMAGNLGFNVFVLADGTHTFNRRTYDGQNLAADQVQAFALASLHEEFATVVDSASVLEGLRG